MKLAQVLILSLLPVTVVRADQLTRGKTDSYTKPDANHAAQPLTATRRSLWRYTTVPTHARAPPPIEIVVPGAWPANIE